MAQHVSVGSNSWIWASCCNCSIFFVKHSPIIWYQNNQISTFEGRNAVHICKSSLSNKNAYGDCLKAESFSSFPSRGFWLMQWNGCFFHISKHMSRSVHMFLHCVTTYHAFTLFNLIVFWPNAMYIYAFLYMAEFTSEGEGALACK